MADVGKLFDLVMEVRQALPNIARLEESQKALLDALDRLDQRVRALETDLQVARADIRHEALKEAGDAVQTVQGALFDRMTDLAVRIDRLEVGRSLPSREKDASLPESDR